MKVRLLCAFILASLAVSSGSFSQNTQRAVSTQEREVYSNHAEATKSGLLSWKWELSEVIGALPSGVAVEVLASKEVGHGKFWKQVEYFDTSRNRQIRGWVFCGSTLDGCP